MKKQNERLQNSLNPPSEPIVHNNPLSAKGSNGLLMDDITDNNKDSIYQIAESKARQNGANDAHVCIFNEDCIDATLVNEGLL